MRRFLVCCIPLITMSLLLAACGAAAQGPITWLDRPLDGARLPLAPVTMQAHASDADGVASFQFFVDDAPLVTTSADGGRLGTAMVEWNPSAPGTYTIRARGVDSQGNAGSDATSVVTVGELPEASPTVAPEEPPVEPPGEVQINFTADRTNLAPGECATLMWSVQGGEAVALDGEPVPSSGEMEVCPPETTPYTLAVYVGVGPPSPPVAQRELVIVVGEPHAMTPSPTHVAPTATGVPPTATATPAAATPTTPPPSPTSPSGCPGPPVISSFTASPSAITAGQSSTLSWGAVTNGNTNQLVGSVVINPGLGEVGSPGSRVVSPGSTTTYTLVATGCGGTAQQQVTVTVNPAVFSADLAITDLYPETNYGPVWVRITNHGPGTLTNVTVQLSCQWARTILDRPLDTGQMGPMPISISSLSPGQTQEFNTDIAVDLHQYGYDMTCSIQVPFNDPNPGNNSYSEQGW
jgi:hypothetical protein